MRLRREADRALPSLRRRPRLYASSPNMATRTCPAAGRTTGRDLQKAIAAACRRKAVLVVYSLSRLARCTKDAIDLAERLNAAGADLAVIQENVNTRSPMGRFIFTLFSALAQLEREQIADRTSTAMLRHQAKGRRMTRPDRCPYGWRVDPTATRPTRRGRRRAGRHRPHSAGAGEGAQPAGDCGGARPGRRAVQGTAVGTLDRPLDLAANK